MKKKLGIVGDGRGVVGGPVFGGRSFGLCGGGSGICNRKEAAGMMSTAETP